MGIEVDSSNGFNSVERAAMQKALLELVPDLLPWFEFTHGQPFATLLPLRAALVNPGHPAR